MPPPDLALAQNNWTILSQAGAGHLDGRIEYIFIVVLVRPQLFTPRNASFLVSQLFHNITSRETMTMGLNRRSWVTFLVKKNGAGDPGVLYERPANRWRHYVRSHVHLFANRMREASLSDFDRLLGNPS